MNLYESYCSAIAAQIERSDLNAALILIMRISAEIANSQASLGEVFSAPRLDQLAQKIGAEVRKSRGRLNNVPAGSVVQANSGAASRKKDGRSRIVYLVSELYVLGGHTRFLEDVVRLQASREHYILVTNPFSRNPATTVPEFIAQAAGDVVIAPADGNLLNKLVWVQDKLDELAPDAVVILNHHEDAIAIAAPDCSRVRTVFIHHADYTFCLGVHMENVIHVDGIPRLFHACRQQRGIANRYWTVSVPDLGARATSSIRRDPAGLVTCSCGSTPKFTGRYPFSYFTEVANILCNSGGRHVHVGPLTDAQLTEIRDGLAARGIDQGRFLHIPWVRSLWRTLVEQEVGLYVSSFPIFGTRATLEVLGSGTPILAHVHHYNSCMSDVQLLYPGCLAWRTLEDLYGILKTVDSDLLVRHAALGRKWYEDQYPMEGFAKCLDTIVAGEVSIEPFQLSGSEPDSLSPFLAIGRLAEAANQKLGISAAFHEIGLSGQAMACSMEIMQLERVVASAYHQAGQRMLAAQDWATAKTLLSRAIEIHPGVPQYLNSLACALYPMGELDLVIRNLEQALAVNPDFKEARANLETALRRKSGVGR